MAAVQRSGAPLTRALSVSGGSAPADPGFRSLLYEYPQLYDLVFPGTRHRLGDLCREAFRRYQTATPRSALDIGCGSGQFLGALSENVPDRWGVDLLASNVAYAKATQPRAHIAQGDMRTLRLGRTFDLVTSFGNALSYALTDGDLAETAKTYAAHAHRGTLLIVDALNARSYLDGGGFRERIEGKVETPEFQATSVSTHVLDRAARILTRTRLWYISGQPPIEDHARYRLIHPEELRQLLQSAGFELLDLFDNRQFWPTDLAGGAGSGDDFAGMRGRKLYAFARRG
jgi:SAM-dependent methyltransferase